MYRDMVMRICIYIYILGKYPVGFLDSEVYGAALFALAAAMGSA